MESPSSPRPDPAAKSSAGPDPEEPSGAELELASEIDRLAQAYRERLRTEPYLQPEAYAAECPAVPTGLLLPVLKGMGALTRTSQRIDGPFAIGERVGHYVIRGVIGRGGMGLVYEAEEEGLGRIVALKAMYEAADERVRVRFAREARAAARLDHPSIVPVFGSGSHGGVLWYAMRRVDGIGLDDVLRRLRDEDEGVRSDALRRLGAATSISTSSASGLSSLTERERAAVAVSLKLADALSYAHSEGVLHRDVKPGNVLIDRDGSTLLTDFGLCKVDGDASLTRDTDIVGTLRYMPPESFAGQTDVRGDVYGVGLLLLEVLSGRPAFELDDRRVLMQDILHKDPVALRDGSLRASGDLVRVIRKSISKLPEERYATAADLADDLRAVLEGQPVRARATTSPLYLARLFVRRNRALSATLAGALLALGLGAAFYIAELRAANSAISEARDIAEQRAAEASVASAEATLRIGDTSGAATALDGVEEPHRGWMWRHLAQRIGRETPALEVDLVGDSPQSFSVAQDRSMAALAGRERILILQRSPDAAPGIQVLRVIDEAALDVRFHPNGDLYWVGRTSRDLMRLPRPVEGADPADPADPVDPVRVAQLPARATMLRFAPDGGVALILDGYNTIVAFDIERGEETWRRSAPVPRIDSLEALSATEFVFGTTGGQVVQGSADSETMSQVARHFGRVRGLLAEDGELLASGGQTGQLDLEQALTGHTRVRVRLESPVLGIARHPSERDLLAVSTESGSVAIVHVKSGAVVRRLSGLRAEPVGLWGAEDPWFSTATLDARVLCHSEFEHDGRIELPPAVGNLGSPTVSSDGRWVSAASNDGTVQFHDLSSGRRVGVALGEFDSDLEPAVRGDGRLACVAHLIVDLEEGQVARELELSQLSPRERRSVRSCWLANGALVVAGQGGEPDSPQHLALWRAEADAVDTWLSASEDAPSPLGDPTAEPGAPAIQVTAHPKRAEFFVLGRDGTLSAFRGAALGLAWTTRVEGGARRFAIHGEDILVAGTDGLVRVLDAATGARLEERDWKAAQGVARKSGLNSIASGPGSDLVTTCTVSGRVEVWSVADRRRVGTVSSGESYLRFVAPVPGGPWILGAGGFGRLVLIGHGEPPVTSAALKRFYLEGGSPEGRIDEVIASSKTGSGQRGRAASDSMLRALERSFRYRKSAWTEAQKRRLRGE